MAMRLFAKHIHQNPTPWDGAPPYAIELGLMGLVIIELLEKIMPTLEETLVLVQKESTLDDSLIALLTSIEGKLADALSGTTLPPGTQAKIDAVFNQVTDNIAKVTAATVANTPVGTPVVPAPPVTTPPATP